MKDPKNIFFSVLLTFIASALYAQEVEVRDVSDFNKIKTGGSWDVVLEEGDEPEVRIEARNLDLDRVITEVENGTLNVHLEKGNYRNLDLTVYVTYVDLERIQSGGSGNLKCVSDLVADKLEISLSGSGDASFKNVKADELHLSMSGSGNVQINAGTVDKTWVEQSGSGNFNAKNLEAAEADIRKSGSGNAALTVNHSLSVRSSGSGNVEYQGSPTMNDVRISGSGRVVKK